jgi:hypothetical protein
MRFHRNLSGNPRYTRNMRFVPALILAASVFAQSSPARFRDLATIDDGSLLYLSTGSKILVFDGRGSRTFAQQDSATLGWITASGDGQRVAYNALNADGTFQANLASANGSVFWTTIGQAAISRDGRFALFVPGDGTVSLTDLSDGTGQTFPADSPFPLTPNGRTISSAGTVVLRGAQGLSIISPAAAQQFAEPSMPQSVTIDDAATTVIYELPGQIFALDLGSGDQSPVVSGQAPTASADGRTILYLDENHQAWIIQRDGSNALQLTQDAAGIAKAVLSGDGSTAFAITLAMHVLRIDVASDAVRDITADVLGTAAKPTDAPAPMPPPAGAPQITTFTSDPVYSTASDNPVTLRWTTANAVSVGMTGPGLPSATLQVNGSVVVNPASNTTYTLIAYGGSGQAVSATLYVFVR